MLQETLASAFAYSRDSTPLVTSIDPPTALMNESVLVTFAGVGLAPETDGAASMLQVLSFCITQILDQGLLSRT